MSRIAIITARGGSKRIPGKNIRDFCGKPIIAYSIMAALDSALFDEVMVSTDNDEIAVISEKYGAKVPFLRSKEMSSDFAATDDVLREVLAEYAKRGQHFTLMCCLYPTAPFVTAHRLKESVAFLEKSSFEALMPVVQFSYPPQRGLNISNGRLTYIYPEFIKSRSQDLLPVYHDCGQYYIYKIRLDNTFCDNEYLPFLISELEVQDIDNEDDWKIAELKYQMLREGIM